MASSEIDICNMAMSHIGNRARVTSIDPPDPSIESKHCSTFYPIARNVALEEGPAWRFAKSRKALAGVSKLDDGEWSFAYALPSGMLQALKVLPPGATNDHPSESFIIEIDADSGDPVLYTDTENAVLHYIFQQENTGYFSPLFVSALSYLLASYVAGPILKGQVGTKVKRTMYEVYLTEIKKAAASDLNQQEQPKQYSDHEPVWMSDR